ncbi:hypothetical protein WN944_007262 [Citrus x changshan-huyou]|uniref:Uncharacterized protein n=1 Tax=Citrus x changshan-huyou TaxID=2935761 RepID=A0AAP0MN68_9ROSI
MEKGSLHKGDNEKIDEPLSSMFCFNQKPGNGPSKPMFDSLLAVSCTWFGIRIRLDSNRLVSAAAGFEDERGCADSGAVVGLAGCRWVNGFKTNDRMRLVLLLLGEIRLGSARIRLDSSRSMSAAAESEDGRGCADSGVVVGLSPVG